MLIWLITGVIGVVIGLVIALPMLVIVVPAVIGFATSKGDLPTTALLVSGLCFVVYLPILILVHGHSVRVRPVCLDLDVPAPHPPESKYGDARRNCNECVGPSF